MSQKNSTTVTFHFEGKDHLNAADALFVQALRAPLEDEIKSRLTNGGFTITDMSATGLREITVKLG